MDGWYHGAMRVKDSRNTACQKTVPVRFELLIDQRGNLSVHHGRIHSSLFKYISIGDHTGKAATAALPLPTVLPKFTFSVRPFNALANGVLKLMDVLYKILTIARHTILQYQQKSLHGPLGHGAIFHGPG